MKSKSAETVSQNSTKMLASVLLILLGLGVSGFSLKWGFFAHERINRLAVFTLPQEMIGFYKKHIVYLTENAVNPDRRRYAVKGEAPRHYLDMDVYGDSAWYELPHRWADAVEKYSEDTLQAYGIVPWHITLMKYRLTDAFKERDVASILRLSADIGHYIGDANVPLHTTENYNGQFTGQHGIHGLWESRLPELFSDQYEFFVGPAEYLDDPQETAWLAIKNAHNALDSVLRFEKELSTKFSEGKKYSYEEKGAASVRVYSRRFCQAYHTQLNGMVERRFRASVKMVGDFWYTCWVDAGQPDLRALMDISLSQAQKQKLEKDKERWNNRTIKSREHN